MSISIRQLVVGVLAGVFLAAAQASAQLVTKVEDLTLRNTLSQLTGPVSAPVADALALATQLEVSTVPFGSSSGGFVFKLDPSTGLLVRSATTFGPSFAERALTSGEGQVSIGASFASFSYNRLNDLEIDDGKTIALSTVRATTAAASLATRGAFELSSRVLVMSGNVGVTENIDVGVSVPLVSIKLEGSTSTVNGSNVVTRSAVGTGVFTGLGDIGAIVKYRFVKFGEEELPDPGGVAAVVTMVLPTGSTDNLRGLGVTRTGFAVVASGRMGLFQPHANVGYERWSDAIEVATTASGVGGTASIRDQFRYAFGTEIEAAPKLTLLVDLLGNQVRGGGKLGYVSRAGSGSTISTESLVVLPEGINKMTLVPGLKLNLKAKMLFSLNVLIALKDNGLHAGVTPVAGISLTP